MRCASRGTATGIRKNSTEIKRFLGKKNWFFDFLPLGGWFRLRLIGRGRGYIGVLSFEDS